MMKNTSPKMPSGAAAPHTPEPWAHRVDIDGRDIVVSEPTETILVRHDPWLMPVKAEVEANADRIVACVNAMAGISDPQGAMRALYQLVLAVGHDPILSKRQNAGHPVVQAASAALAALGGGK